MREKYGSESNKNMGQRAIVSNIRNNCSLTHIFEESFKGFARKIRVCELDPMQEASVVE